MEHCGALDIIISKRPSVGVQQAQGLQIPRPSKPMLQDVCQQGKGTHRFKQRERRAQFHRIDRAENGYSVRSLQQVKRLGALDIAAPEQRVIEIITRLNATSKIATYNVNGINGRLPVLLRWMGEAAPDIVCLPELKAPEEKFPEAAIRDAGYDAIWHGQSQWNGVAILGRVGEIHETRRGASWRSWL